MSIFVVPIPDTLHQVYDVSNPPFIGGELTTRPFEHYDTAIRPELKTVDQR